MHWSKKYLVVIIGLLFIAIFFLKETVFIPFDFSVNHASGTAAIVLYNGEENVDIPSKIFIWKVTEIKDKAFSGNCNIKKVTVPDTVKRIGSDAFSDCKALEKVILPDKLQFIDDGVFKGCENLKQIKMPENLTKLGKNVFEKCVSLKEISLPQNIKSIGCYAFLNCENLKTVSLSHRLEHIGKFAFANCTSLEEILNISDSLKVETGAFYNTAWMNNIQEEYVIIGDQHYIFTGKKSAVSVPGGIKTIDFYSNSDVQKITLPKSLEEFSEYCLYNCTNLKLVNMATINLPLKEFAFGICPNVNFVDRQTKEQWNLLEYAELFLGEEAFHDAYFLIEEIPMEPETEM